MLILRQLARDLNIPTRVEGRPIVREADGLALSSRNTNLTAEERAEAPNIYKGLQLAKELVSQGERSVGMLRENLADYYGRALRLVGVWTISISSTPGHCSPWTG